MTVTGTVKAVLGRVLVLDTAHGRRTPVIATGCQLPSVGDRVRLTRDERGEPWLCEEVSDG